MTTKRFLSASTPVCLTRSLQANINFLCTFLFSSRMTLFCFIRLSFFFNRISFCFNSESALALDLSSLVMYLSSLSFRLSILSFCAPIVLFCFSIKRSFSLRASLIKNSLTISDTLMAKSADAHDAIWGINFGCAYVPP